jgi:hypothetical protein
MSDDNIARWNTPGLKWGMPGLRWGGPNPLTSNQNAPMSTQQNLADVTISATAHTGILTNLGTVRTAIEAVATEVPADLAENLFRLGDKRQMFDQLCDQHIHQFAATKPAELDLAKYDSDGDSITKLRAYKAILDALSARVDGAIALHGSDRMDADVMYFNFQRFGKQMGWANSAAIYDTLLPHYSTGRRGSAAAPAKNPA